jgi:uncharacterized protein (TIGR03435 family)
MNAHIADKTGLTGKYDFTIDWIPEGVTMIQEPDSKQTWQPPNQPSPRSWDP